MKKTFLSYVAIFMAFVFNVSVVAQTVPTLEKLTGDEEIYHFYLSQGVAVDAQGITYVTAATDGASDGGSDRADTQKRGIFVYDAELNCLNPENVGFLPANAAALMTDVSRQAMHRIAVNPVNGQVAFCYNVEGASAIWSMDPANLTGDAVNLIEGLAITKANAFCFDAEGTLYVMDNANTADGGKIVKVVNGELITIAQHATWGVQDISLASDGKGGLWVAQNRWAVDDYAVLSHVNAAGEVDFLVNGDAADEVKALFPNDYNASYRGQCAYNVDKDILAFGGNKVVTLFQVTYDEATGVPSIAKLVSTEAIGSNIDGIAFYPNGDLAVVSASAERFIKYAVNYGEPAIEWIPMPLEITNLTTMEIPVGDQTVLQLMGRNDMMDSDVMLFLNNYTGEDKAYEVNAESSLVTFGGMELTVMDGTMTKTTDAEKGDVFAGTVHAFVEEDGEGLYVEFALTMYAQPAIEIAIEDVEITVDEESAIATFAATWEGSPLSVEVSGFEEVEFKEYPECWLSIGDDNVWVDAAAGPVAVIIEDGVAMLEGEFTSFATGKSYYVMLSGKLPVKEEPVVEPVYEENKLNPFAFGLESVLSEDASVLTVTYRLNNSNATSVDVVVYNGEEVVATVPGTTTIGVNVVEVATADLPAGVQLTWGIVVKGTSVEAPTQEEKMYSLYCPHGLAIDKDPESENFGRILVAEAMQGVPASGYVTSGKGAGLYVFNPSFTTDSVTYTGGNDFTRILASNGYQPWRVKISEDGRIFVSSLDLNGVVVWEVSKDLQTWTPVIAGTNDATDHNIYDADGNFVAGLNCSMDVIGSGEDLKLLLYSTNNKGIAFNQSGYRLDEYALGTATTWTGTPTNIINGGAYGLVHTNVEFIYDGEGGYWFGASRAGNAGQPNLVHINAAGEQDYYTEDAGLYGGDGVLVHNGMLFKGKARTSSTVGNFGVWTIGKDEAGKVTLTEKWTVAANGIGRNLNEFAVDYAENLYIVGNSGEKIIAYALPYSGEVTTPAATKYAFKLAAPVEIVGVVKRAITVGESTVVLTHEENGTAHLYKVVDGKPVAELSQTGIIAVDPTNAGDYLALSDIAATEDGKLVGVNYMMCQGGDDYVDAGYVRGENRFYLWDSLDADPTLWFSSKMSSNWFRSKQGYTMAVKGTSQNAEIFTTGVHGQNGRTRFSWFHVIDGVFEEPAVNNNDYYHFHNGPDDIHASGNSLEAKVGTQYELNASPLAADLWIMDGNLVEAYEYALPATNNVALTEGAALAIDLGKKFNGATYVTVGEQHLMVAPYATAEGLLAGVKVLDITAGLAAATEVATVELNAAVEATAAATAVAVAENVLTITLVADAALHTLVVELAPATPVINLTATGLETTLEDDGSYTLQGMAVVNGDESNLMEFMLCVYPTEGYTDAFLNNWSVMIFGAPTPGAFVENADGTFTYKAQLEDNGTVYNVDMSGTIKKTDGPVYTELSDEITNLTIDLENKVVIGGPSKNYEIEVVLGLGEANSDGSYSLASSSTVSIKDMPATFIEGYVYDFNPAVPSVKALIKVDWDGMYYAFTLTMTAEGTGVDNVQVDANAVKLIKNGQLLIHKDGVEYNVQGSVVK